MVSSWPGFRQLKSHLRRKYNLQVTRDTVMKYLCIIDPEGVECRKRRRLKRRRYITTGPNFLWHVDGWDKLAHFGIFIHGAVDGFSRRILWLEANSTNKNPGMIASHYLNSVQQLEGVPLRVRWTKERRILSSAFSSSILDGMMMTILLEVKVVSKATARVDQYSNNSCIALYCIIFTQQ